MRNSLIQFLCAVAFILLIVIGVGTYLQYNWFPFDPVLQRTEEVST